MARGKVSTNGWVRLGKIRSDSDAGKWYILGSRLLKTGKVEFGCDCPSRIYRKGVKPQGEFEVTCKHIRAVLAGAVTLADLDLTPEGVRFLDVLKTGQGAPLAHAEAKAAGLAAMSVGLTDAGGRGAASLAAKVSNG